METQRSLVRPGIAAVLIVALLGVFPSPVIGDDGGTGTGPPGAPTDPQILTTTPFLTIVWAQPDGGPAVLGYNVYSVDPLGVVTLEGTTSALLYMSGGPADPLADYFVAAFNSAGQGPADDSGAPWPFRCDPVHTHVYNVTDPSQLDYHIHIHFDCLPG